MATLNNPFYFQAEAVTHYWDKSASILTISVSPKVSNITKEKYRVFRRSTPKVCPENEDYPEHLAMCTEVFKIINEEAFIDWIDMLDFEWIDSTDKVNKLHGTLNREENENSLTSKWVLKQLNTEWCDC